MNTTHHIVIALSRDFVAPTVDVHHFLRVPGKETFGHSSTSWGVLDDDALLDAIDADIDEALMRLGHQCVSIEVKSLAGIGEHLARKFGLDDSATVMMDDCGRPNLLFGDWAMAYEGSLIRISRYPNTTLQTPTAKVTHAQAQAAFEAHIGDCHLETGEPGEAFTIAAGGMENNGVWLTIHPHGQWTACEIAP